MRRSVVYFCLLVFGGCAKLMEDQPQSTDSSQVGIDTVVGDTAISPASSSKIPERFQHFFYREFTGTLSASTGRVHTLPVESIMDVLVESKAEIPNLIFTIKKDGLDITEEPTTKWYGRLVPGKYMIAVLPNTQAKLTRATPYSIIVKEE